VTVDILDHGLFPSTALRGIAASRISTVHFAACGCVSYSWCRSIQTRRLEIDFPPHQDRVHGRLAGAIPDGLRESACPFIDLSQRLLSGGFIFTGGFSWA